MRRYYVTSESVTMGHPDKMCDIISDSILDAILEQDKDSRVAIETTCTTGMVNIMGEVTTTAIIDYAEIARNAIINIGYDSSKKYFDGNTCGINVSIHKQSPDIAMGVDRFTTLDEFDAGSQLGAGDQGMMFGYANTDTPTLMPASIYYAHRLAKQLDDFRKVCKDIYPDGKTQVTVEYDKDKLANISNIVISTQHSIYIDDMEDLKKVLLKNVVYETLPQSLLQNTTFYVNPTGRFVIGGPAGDTGLTGRKIIVDNYGADGHVGGGAFSGKDPTKVDRSGAYMARYIAKNIVGAGLADRCEVQLSYTIGRIDPTSIYVNTFNTNAKYSEEKIENAVKEVFDLTPSGIIKTLDLKNIQYQNLAVYGHMGRQDLDVPWENVDKDEELLRMLSK